MHLLDDYLLVGKNAMIRRIVQKCDTANNYSIGLNELLSSPSCVDMAIHAAVEAVAGKPSGGYLKNHPMVACSNLDPRP